MLRVSDHALVRFLDRVGGLEVEQVRAALEASLTRAADVAGALGMNEYSVHVDGLIYRVRDRTVVTIVADQRERRKRRPR